MKITSIDQGIAFEYHNQEGDVVKAQDCAPYERLLIVSGGVIYTVFLDETGALIVRPDAGIRLEAVNVSPRSANDLRIWCELWQPPA